MIENDVERSLSSSQEFSKWQEFDSNIDIDAKFTNLETRKVWMKIASWLASFGFVKYGTITYSIELCVWLSKCALLFDWLDDIWTSCRSISSVPPPPHLTSYFRWARERRGREREGIRSRYLRLVVRTSCCHKSQGGCCQTWEQLLSRNFSFQKRILFLVRYCRLKKNHDHSMKLI